MTKIDDLEWIDENNKNQCLWYKNYLSRKGIQLIYPRPLYYPGPIQPPPPTDFEVVTATIRTSYSTNKELIRRMRGAWSQHKFRSKGNRKPYNFVMSANIGSKLRSIAGDQPVNQILENIINRDADFQKMAKKELRDEINKKKEELEARWPKGDKNRGLNELLLRDELEEAKRYLSFQKEITEKWLLELCQCQVLLVDHGIAKDNEPINKLLSTSQKEQVMQKFNTLVDYSEKACKLHKI